MTSSRILPALITVLSFALPAGTAAAQAASALKEDLEIFEQICLSSAPALSEAEISAKVTKVKVHVQDVIGGGRVKAKNGKSCAVSIMRSSMLVPPVPENAAAALVNAFAARIGATEVKMKSRKNGNMLSYFVTAGKTEFEIHFEADRSVRRLSIWK